MITKAQREKLLEIELLCFNEGIRLYKERDEWRTANTPPPIGMGSGEWLEKFNSFDPPPFFNLACCTKIVESMRHEHDDGVVCLNFHYEWDHDAIKIFKDGVMWANEHGAGIPDDSTTTG